MPDCTFVTYAALPDLDPDDRLAADALRERDVDVAAAVWDDPAVDWSSAGLCVLRSTWDYPAKYPAFSRWLDATAELTRICNDVALVRWNAHKFYLRDLEDAMVPVVPTAYLERGAAVDVNVLLAQRGWSEAVVKPAVGAGTVGVQRIEPSKESRQAGLRHLAHLLQRGDVLVQPYLYSVTEYAERALVFIEGRYSHGVAKQAFQALLPAGEAGETPVEATQEEILVAQSAMRAVPGRPAYARVDLVRDAHGTVRVMEVELIEPSLFFSMHRSAAEAFAAAVERRL